MNQDRKVSTVVLPALKVWSSDSVELRNLVLLNEQNSEKQRIQGEFFVKGNPSGKIALDILPPPKEIRNSIEKHSSFPSSMWRFQYWYFKDDQNCKLIACSDKDSCHLVIGETPGLLIYEWLYRVYLSFLREQDEDEFNKVKDDILSFYGKSSLSDVLPAIESRDDEFQNFLVGTNWNFTANLVREQ